MTIRDIRQAPFCWQAKSALQRLRRHYSGERLKQRATAIAIYTALTEIASNQHSQDRVEAFVAQIVNLTGTSEATVKRYLRDFEERIGLIAVERRKIANTVSLANVYNLLTVPHDPPGFTGEPRGSTDVRSSGFTSEPRGPTHEPSGDAYEPLTEQNHEQRYQQKDEQQHAAPNGAQGSIGKPDVVVVNSADLIQLLTERGITATVAQRLVTQHSPAVVTLQIEHFDWECDEEPDNPKIVPGRLRRRIEEDWAPPPGFVSTAERERLAAEEEARRSTWKATYAAESERGKRERAALLAAIGVGPDEQAEWHALTDNPTRLPQVFRNALFRPPHGQEPPVVIFRTPEEHRSAVGSYHAKDRQEIERRLQARFPDYMRIYTRIGQARTRYMTYDEYAREVAGGTRERAHEAAN